MCGGPPPTRAGLPEREHGLQRREVSRKGPALCDLLYLAMHSLWWVRDNGDEKSRRSSFRTLFVDPAENDPLIGAIRGEIRHYISRLAIDAKLVPLLLVNTVVTQALDRVERLRPLGDDVATSRDDNRYVGYFELLTERPEALFGGAEHPWWA